MKHWVTALGFAFLCSAPWLAVADTVVNFDDLTVDRTPVPDGYGGINWGGSFLLFTDHYAPYAPHSYNNSVYTPFLTGPVTGAYPFSFVTPGQDFEGAWFSGYSDTTVQFDLYSGGHLVATSAELTPNSTPTFLASGYSGPVDSVAVYSTKNGYYVMDDVTYKSGIGTVPEPSAGAAYLLASAVLGASWMRRRRSR